MKKNDSQSNVRKVDQSVLRALPGVDECLQALFHLPEFENIPLIVIKNSVRDIIDTLRQQILQGDKVPVQSLEISTLLPLIRERIHKELQPRFRRVINCTGVIIHTNLGRSILPQTTMNSLHEAGSRYSNLEFDLDTGKRGSRYSHVEKLLCQLTGAEAGLVVNNNAAAVLLVLETLAKNREVIVSRGQLVEIGGSFRVPDVMARSGAELVEVGATNRTHIRDYEDAITEATALLLKVHCSNFRIIGFTKEVNLPDLVAIGRRRGIPVMEDLGSGCLVDLSRFGLEKEPTVQEVVAAGVDVVTFSGDKLLGGPQAGIILGRKEIVDRIKKNPVNRAMRIDKFTLSGLESILRLYLDEENAMQQIPTLAMIAAPVADVERRAKRLLRRVRKDLAGFCQFSIIETAARVGGGAMPEQNLPSRALVLQPAAMTVNRLETALRQLAVPVVGRVEENRLLLDMRTVADDEIDLLSECLHKVLTAAAA
ncbi:MAG: L-seryl-tRNA(Sec) selenium transferase [Desulfobulbaceae bacterium]|nr:L-seryl-tRNA(Sec) selenium transferase [Desulfobulbaceae bacterium]